MADYFGRKAVCECYDKFFPAQDILDQLTVPLRLRTYRWKRADDHHIRNYFLY